MANLAWPHTSYDISTTPFAPVQHGSVAMTGLGLFALGVGQMLMLVGIVGYGVRLGLGAHQERQLS